MDIFVIIVKVVLPFPIKKYFKYFMPDFMNPIIGGRIIVPFNSKDIIGIVVSCYNVININEFNLKYVKSVIDTQSFYTKVVQDILIWISNNYHCPVGKIFFSIYPSFLYNSNISNIIKNKIIYRWTITEKGNNTDLNDFKRRKKQLYALSCLKKNSILSTDLDKYQISKIILKKLEIQELCKVHINAQLYIQEEYNHVFIHQFFLNKKILMNIHNILVKNCFSSWLLTKTNLYKKVKFYLGLIQEALSKDMQILILVPYVKDIHFIVFFLKKYFNVSIDIFHSKLNKSKYLKNWIRTKNGDNTIIVGTGKSIFLPFLKLGIIILLEEHNLNYKSMNQCRYNIRDISILRAYKENIPIILDSDTPSLKTLYDIISKKCSYIKLHKNNYFHKLNSSIINLKREKIKFGLSLTLINEIHNNFYKKQVLLIFSKFSLFFLILTCDMCGWIYKCLHCDNYFEINRYQNILFCKFCLISIKKPIFCFNCGYCTLIIVNIGIKNIQHQIQNIFPKMSLFFLLNKNDINNQIFDKNFFKFSINTPCIIFTTEQIVKNYVFPFVELISLICIDHYFLSFKFRNIEYFAQFYINLSKLVKNGQKKARILIQTTVSNNQNLQELCDKGYFSFANTILKIRKKFLLPPWNCQSVIYVESVSYEKNIMFLNLLRTILQIKSHKYNFFIWCVGPYPAFLLKNQKKIFHKLSIHHSSRVVLNTLLNKSIDIIHFFSISKKVKWFVDIESN